MTNAFQLPKTFHLLALLLGLICFCESQLQAASGLTFTVVSASGAPGTQVLVPVQVAGFSNINGLQFSFHWNSSQASFVDVELFGVPGLGAGNFGPSSGTLTLSWDDTSGASQSLPDGTTAFVVRLRLIGPLGSTSSLLINDTPTQKQAYNGALQDVPLTVVSGQLTIGQPNTAPVLTAIGDKTINEGSLLTFTATATDAELPSQTLTYTLDAGAPSGASINATNGLFTWTPTELQGPSTNPVTIRVTDNGSPPLTDAQTITITVNEVNSPPVLSPVGNKTVSKGSLLTFTASATDPDLPAQTLTYTLDAGAPAGASINPSNGVFTWTPSPTQGPSTNTVTIRVTDNGPPPLSDFKTITITVLDVNTAPVLASLPNRTVDEGTLLSFTASATDTDLPAQTLTYTLDAGAPAGASIAPATGGFTWTPTLAQGPSTNTVTIRVTDSGSPPLSDSKTITITVNDVNTPPVLGAIGNKSVNEGALLTFTATATDAGIPAQTLTFTLDSGAPTGASINAVSGVFTWTPTSAQGPSTNTVTVRVTDSGSPPLSDSKTITITVFNTNTAPVLSAISNKTVNEGTLLTFTAMANDIDLPAQTLIYTLDSGAPSGATIGSSSGVFNWTPTEAQGPSTNTVTIRVTDNGFPAMSDFKIITITVNEVNIAPVLTPIGNKTIDEGNLFTFTATATDADLPAQTLAFSLVGTLAGASIDPVTGVFHWTPTEAQGPSTNTVTLRVTDNGIPPMSSSSTFTITVNEVNSPPIIPPISNKTVFEGSLLTFPVIATDADLPPQTLTWSLASGALAGARINPTNGLFTWTPPEALTPTTNTMAVIVSDNGSPSLSATQSFTVAVSKTNHPPVFAALGNYLAEVLLPLKVTNVVTDPDLPTNHVSFELAAAPKGTRINKYSGLVVWSPSRDQARSTNSISVFATDDGIPPLSTTNSFQVIVDDYLELGLGRSVIRSGQSGSVPITVTNTTGVTNLSSTLFVPLDGLTNLSLSSLASELKFGTLTPQGGGLSQLNFGTRSGKILQPGEVLAQFNFKAISAHSAFVPLVISNLTSLQTNGIPLNRTIGDAGRVVVVANEPLVEALTSTNQQPLLVLYGQVGWTNLVQVSTDPLGGSNTWQTAWQGTLTNLFQTIQPVAPTNADLFFRAFRK